VSPPQPWEQMPLTWDRAYGGVDPSVSPDSFDNAMDLLSASVIDPGAYPRNDLGRGYRVARRSASSEDSIRLPNLELPDDQITVDRLECRQSSAWHRQPRPAGFGFVLPHWFPRSLHVGVIAGPWPDLGAGPLPEEVLGLLPSGFLDAQRAQKEELSVSPGFLQVSAPGMAFPDLTGVESMALEGLDGNRHLELTLPGGRPAAALQLAKGRLDLAARLLQIVLEVDSAVLTMLWSASVALDDPHVVGIPSAELLALPVAVI